MGSVRGIGMVLGELRKHEATKATKTHEGDEGFWSQTWARLGWLSEENGGRRFHEGTKSTKTHEGDEVFWSQTRARLGWSSEENGGRGSLEGGGG